MNPPSAARPSGPPPVVQEIIFDAPRIQKRVEALAGLIAGDYAGRDLLVVCILKGAAVFTSDLIRCLPFPVRTDFMAISRYLRRPRTGAVRIIQDLQEQIGGRDVLMVEDIVDTGLTLNYLVGVLRQRRPASLAICSLLDRPDLRLADIPIRYRGFNVGHEFLIGYGLDYRELYRDLPFIASMDPSALPGKSAGALSSSSGVSSGSGSGEGS